MEEIWKDIDCVYGKYSLYQISNFGNMRKVYMHPAHIGHPYRPLKTKVIYKRNGRNGCDEEYINIRVGDKNKHLSIHRLVADAFIPNPNGYKYVTHKDGVGLNNHVDNLQWSKYKFGEAVPEKVKRHLRNYKPVLNEL